MKPRPITRYHHNKAQSQYHHYQFKNGPKQTKTRRAHPSVGPPPSKALHSVYVQFPISPAEHAAMHSSCSQHTDPAGLMTGSHNMLLLYWTSPEGGKRSRWGLILQPTNQPTNQQFSTMPGKSEMVSGQERRIDR